MKINVPLSTISNNLLYHYPAEQVFNAAVLAVNSLPKLRVDMIDGKAGYIEVFTLDRRKRFIVKITIKINSIELNSTNLLITYDETVSNDITYVKAKHIRNIVYAISSNLA